MERTQRTVTITDLAEAVVRATDAAVAAALVRYRMAGFKRPFSGRSDKRWNHLFRAGEGLALCQGLAVARPGRMRPADLLDVDCLACLDAFTEETRPKHA